MTAAIDDEVINMHCNRDDCLGVLKPIKSILYRPIDILNDIPKMCSVQ